jgi:glucose-6-phosphate 1-dehydrogenase
VTDIVIEERPAPQILGAAAPEPCVMVIFGASGDLTQRKLVPALVGLAENGALPEPFAVLGFGRRPMEADAFRARLKDGVARFARAKPNDESAWPRLAARLDYLAGAYDEPRAYAALATRLSETERRHGIPEQRLYYLATPPELFPVILGQLRDARLLARHPADGAPWPRVIVEKPYGRDLASARALERLAAETLDERQIFRIDHYLGKETVQNILVFRFGNAIFEPLWNREHVDHVEITAAEEIGVEGRGEFYDGTGVLRDIVQNHLLQLLALSAMEPPVSFGSEDIRDETARVLRALRPITGRDAADAAVRAQYRGYREEPGVDTASRTPTYAALRVLIDNWRWQGVPFYLRAGKRLAARLSEVAIHFRPVPHCLFRQDDLCQRLEPNVLRLRIQPEEGIALRFESKVPGDQLAIGGVHMDFSYARSFRTPPHDAYERLLLDCMRGHGALFVRRDAIEHQWAFATPILQAWEASADPVPVYEPGTPGPREADRLIGRDGHAWTSLERRLAAGVRG